MKNIIIKNQDKKLFEGFAFQSRYSKYGGVYMKKLTLISNKYKLISNKQVSSNNQIKEFIINCINFEMSWNSLSNWIWSSKQVSLDTKKQYLRVQFLTQDQKIKKDIALQPLLQQFKNDTQTLIPYDEYYKCSHRFTFKAPRKNPLDSENNTILVKEIVANIILSENEETRNFYENNVNGIEFIMQNNQTLNNNDMVYLYNQNQIFVYDPSTILEIIYNEKSFWERMKNKTKATIKKIPCFFGTLLQKIISFILAILGLNGGITTLLWKSLPTSQIISFATMIVTMFFPAFGPILGLSKFIF